MEALGRLYLDIGQDFDKFQTISKKLLEKLDQKGYDIKKQAVTIPKYKLDTIQTLSFNSVSYASKLVGGGVAGAAAAYAVYGGTIALGAASTGTAISALSGVAAYNATLAAIGGGSLAAGGLGMAGGTMILGGVVAAPVLAIAGWAYAWHGEEALQKAKEARRETDEFIANAEKATNHLKDTAYFVAKIQTNISPIYNKFKTYLKTLIDVNKLVEENRVEVIQEKEHILQSVQNGYALAAILSDIITTPIFKVKEVNNGKPVFKQQDGHNVLNTDGIADVFSNAETQVDGFTIK